MVCKKSLYCWKNGPCASEQTRKQIWEDNIRFRKSLRDINQSDHYWSFQISKTLCLCLEGDEILYDRPFSRRFRSGSLQKLHQTDCTSITHDCNGLKYRNCFVHCPIHDFAKDSNEKKIESIEEHLKKEDFGSKYLSDCPHKSDKKEHNGFNFKNMRVNPPLKPGMKMKFSSQTNLSKEPSARDLLLKKSTHTSCENLVAIPQVRKPILPNSKALKSRTEESNTQQICAIYDQKANVASTKEKENLKVKKSKKDLTKLPKKVAINQYTPISRTTKNMLHENKSIPFVTYGYNNSSLDIGCKRTHNVLASKLVYPNALSAKQQKKNLILKYIQSEKEFQKKCFPELFENKSVNHSSLWSVDEKEKKHNSLQKKPTKNILPAMNKQPKKQSLMASQHDSKCYQKPQIYFY